MPGYLVIIFSLSIAFTWVEVLKWGVVKPFTCIRCMTGWIALILAGITHQPCWYLFVFLGVFVGAMFEGLKMRYL